MDEIALQLKEEVKSLQEYIEHTEKRVLATSWVESILDPFEQIESEFAEEEIKEVVEALAVARKRFSINGHLAGRIDGVIDRYKHLIESKDEDEQNLQEIPAEDPVFSPLGLSSYEDDEEHISLDGLHTPDQAQTEPPLPAPTAPLGDLETLFNTTDPPDKTPDILHDNTLTGTAVPEPPIEDSENTVVKTSSPSDQLPDQHPDELFASALLAEQDPLEIIEENNNQDPLSTKPLQAGTGNPDDPPSDKTPDILHDNMLTDTAVPEPPIEDGENTVVKTSSPSGQLPDQHPDELFAPALLAEQDPLEIIEENNNQDPLSTKPLQEDTGNTDDPPSNKTPDILHDNTLTDTAVPELPIEDGENTVVKTSSPSDQLPDQHLDELFAPALLAEQDPPEITEENNDQDLQAAKPLQEGTENPDELFAIALDQPQAETSNNDFKENTLGPSVSTPPKATEHPATTNNPDTLFAAADSTASSHKKRAANKKTDTYNIFSHQIDLEELLLDLGIDIPKQDKTQLKHLYKQKLESRSIVRLKSYQPAADQYVLIPRITRFIHQGTIYPCTVKNLARTFIALFADIKELMQYKTHPFLDSEVPEFGWSIVPAEAPQETLNKNYLHQAQFLRFLSTATRLPSHLVRRRTLVEAVYDIIASRMHLESPMQKATLDWTASGLSKSDFICVFHSEQGLRIRHIKRTQRNKALGLCPNW